jgi:hypothetical protein
MENFIKPLVGCKRLCRSFDKSRPFVIYVSEVASCPRPKVVQDDDFFDVMPTQQAINQMGTQKSCTTSN